MADFTKRIETAEGLAVFSFTRIFTVNGITYFTAVTGRNFRHFFHIEKRGGTWSIINSPKPPDLVYQYENELVQTILENQE